MPTLIIVPLIVACALFMENLDSTVIATSLPAIAADIGTNPLALKLAVTSYLLFNIHLTILLIAIYMQVLEWTLAFFIRKRKLQASSLTTEAIHPLNPKSE